MSVGDKLYIADKQTLDEVKSKVGATTDGGGSATAGTLMGKINALISHLLTNWTASRAGRVDYLDAMISSRQSEENAASRYNTLNNNTGVNNTASATGTLSQKLSHIINLFTSNNQKFLVSKVLNFTVASVGTHTILNVTGAGQFEFAYTNMGANTSALTFEVDGNPVTISSMNGTNYLAQSLYGAGSLVYPPPTTNFTGEEIGSTMRPLCFKNSLKITVRTTDTAERYFRCNYAVYE